MIPEQVYGDANEPLTAIGYITLSQKYNKAQYDIGQLQEQIDDLIDEVEGYRELFTELLKGVTIRRGKGDPYVQLGATRFYQADTPTLFKYLESHPNA